MSVPFFLDTYALMELAAGTAKGREVLKLVKSAEETFTGSLNLYELWYLAAYARGEREADNLLQSVKVLAKILAAGEEECVLAARLK